uniref:Exocyst component Exo84 C-terminal domain-containing protein n=1 Tax=Pinguiococcus pyrenoidosus TaxID=172671 RepID=A0A7R9UGF9_9STRA|mmetsp:Transcript_9540/g.35718  ORF Transcript_9540/g.35718 Transcript_9540/m.35718 type:complete len:550 (+) Transcript_9540:29-1678(+)
MASDAALSSLRDAVASLDSRAFMRAGAEVTKVESKVALVRSTLNDAENALNALENLSLDLGETALREEETQLNLRAEDSMNATANAALRLPRWLEVAPEELEEAILERHSKTAEALIVKVRNFEAQIHDPSAVHDRLREVFEKVRRGAHLLASRLLKEVKTGNAKGSEVWGFRAQEQSYRQLIALGYGEAAAAAFLGNRTHDARRALGVLDVGGDFTAHVQMLTRAFVSVMRAATEEFFSLFATGGNFSHPAAPSQHMAWVDAEVEYFCDILGSKLFATLVTPAAPPPEPARREAKQTRRGLTMRRASQTARKDDTPLAVDPEAAAAAAAKFAKLGKYLQQGDDKSSPNRVTKDGRRSIGKRAGINRTFAPGAADATARKRRATAVVRRRTLRAAGASGAGEDPDKVQTAALRKALIALEENLRPLRELGLLLWPRVGMLLLPHLKEFISYRVKNILTAMEKAVQKESWQCYENTLTIIPYQLYGPFLVEIPEAEDSETGDFYTVTGPFMRSTVMLVRNILKLLDMASNILDLSDGTCPFLMPTKSRPM